MTEVRSRFQHLPPELQPLAAAACELRDGGKGPKPALEASLQVGSSGPFLVDGWAGRLHIHVFAALMASNGFVVCLAAAGRRPRCTLPAPCHTAA